MRHPVTASGRMTRAGGRDVEVGWALFCDTEGCATRSETRPTQNDLPLAEFQDRGWFIAALFGDRCPACVARLQAAPPQASYAPTCPGCGECHPITDVFLADHKVVVRTEPCPHVTFTLTREPVGT